MNLFDMQDRVAVITGSSRGIGRGCSARRGGRSCGGRGGHVKLFPACQKSIYIHAMAPATVANQSCPKNMPRSTWEALFQGHSLKISPAQVAWHLLGPHLARVVQHVAGCALRKLPGAVSVRFGAATPAATT